MDSYKSLSTYLPYFQKHSKTDEDSLNREGEPFVVEQSILHTEYGKTMNQFVKHVHEVDFIDGDCKNTLTEYDVKTVNDMYQKVSTADVRLLKAILTKMIRDERFISGAWLSYAQNGLFEKVIRRIGEL